MESGDKLLKSKRNVPFFLRANTTTQIQIYSLEIKKKTNKLKTSEPFLSKSKNISSFAGALCIWVGYFELWA